MRNRANTPPRNEDAFIHGGSASISSPAPQPLTESAPRKSSKAKPVSISFAEENLSLIDEYIKKEIVAGRTRVNRSDIVRAAIMGLDKLSEEEIAELIQKAKLQ